MATKVIKQVVTNKTQLTWTTIPQKLIATFSDQDQQYLYMVCLGQDGLPTVRKLTIIRDINHAREQMKKAKRMIDQQVRFSVRKGWDGNVWFNDIEAA